MTTSGLPNSSPREPGQPAPVERGRGPRRRYADVELTEAVAVARSWRGVLRHLGMSATSAAAIRSVRSRAAELGLDTNHFTGQRRWTETQLADAIARSTTWSQVAVTLGLAGGSSTSALKGHAARLGIDATHMTRRLQPPVGSLLAMRPDAEQLPRAGSMLAAAWFTLCGFDVSWPLEPCRYDVLVRTSDRYLRVQVKTTRFRTAGSWVARLSSGGRHRGCYDPDDIDYFFVIDGDLKYYLFPVSAVGGLSAIRLSAYQAFKVPRSMPTGD
jgi:hypothetical protein